MSASFARLGHLPLLSSPESNSLVWRDTCRPEVTGSIREPNCEIGMTSKERKNRMRNSRTHFSRRTMLGSLLAAAPVLSQRQLRATAPTGQSLDTEEARVRAALKGAKQTKLVLLGT